jgi:DNA-binding NtrC family response regulator
MTGQVPDAIQTRVLIVEDDEDLGKLLKDMLEGAGHRVCLVETLEAARRQLAQGGFGLAVVDIRLGVGGSGIELLHELAPRAPDVAVVMMTGETTIQTAVDCLRAGRAKRHLLDR